MDEWLSAAARIPTVRTHARTHLAQHILDGADGERRHQGVARLVEVPEGDVGEEGRGEGGHKDGRGHGADLPPQDLDGVGPQEEHQHGHDAHLRGVFDVWGW